MLLTGVFCGLVRVRLVSASVETVLSKISMASIQIRDIVRIDSLVAEFLVLKKDIPAVSDIAAGCGSQLETINEVGFYWRFVRLTRRPVFVIGILLYVLLACFIPTRIFFVEVEGNQSVAKGVILDCAEKAGIEFGSLRSQIRSEQVKNALLSDVPQLQWVGVNTKGCVATITVKERGSVSNEQCVNGICSIVAKCDGIVDSVVTVRGNVLCQVGQAVKKNQVLISGYTDCGIAIKATRAEGEIFAKTAHDLEVVVPLEQIKHGNILHKETRIRLIFGKKQIKLYKDSGISGSGCVKIYEKKILTLPGGFELPVAVVEETLIYYDLIPGDMDEESACALADKYAKRYLTEVMVAGEIQGSSDFTCTQNGALHLYGRYACREMIGKVYEEEIVAENEQGNGKSS